MAGAATEFTIHKIWELLQHPALKHKKLGAEALEASNNLQAIIQGMGEEINALGSLPHGHGAGPTAGQGIFQLAQATD
eukprot:10652585-Karenia_brevis.AAC.1